ncbi:MAG: radical SAM protein [Candidatus Methylomirabilis sp.]
MDVPPVGCISADELAASLFRNLAGGRFPLQGQWELTCRCNLRCIMCYTDCFNTPVMIRQELSLSEIIRIMDEIQEAGCLELCLTGGEPLARKDFLDIYGYAKEKGFLVTVFTNGTLLTESIVDYWIRYPPSMIEISFHGLTQGSFDHITQGTGSYDRCLDGIRMILDRKLPLTLKTTGMTVNRDEVLQIKDFVASLGGGRKVQYKLGGDIRARLDGSEDVYQYQLPDEDIAAIEQADPEFRAERARQDDLEEDFARQGKSLCGSERYKFHIDAYGQLQLCSNNRRQSYDLRHGSFREGFYNHLPQFPCPNRRPQAAEPLLTIERRTHPIPTKGVASYG